MVLEFSWRLAAIIQGNGWIKCVWSFKDTSVQSIRKSTNFFLLA